MHTAGRVPSFWARIRASSILALSDSASKLARIKPYTIQVEGAKWDIKFKILEEAPPLLYDVVCA